MSNTAKDKSIILKDPIEPVEYLEFIPIDEWEPSEEDKIFKTVKGAIILNVSEFYGIEMNTNLDAFMLNVKRSYNDPKMRAHTTQYLNYFEKFYDMDNELLMIFYRLKYLIDYEACYTKEAFIADLEKYIMDGTISLKAGYLTRDNYNLHLTYRNKSNPSLQYSDRHGLILMKISVLMNIMIPLLCHFMYSRSISNSTDFLLEVYDILIHKFDVDIYNKLYETSISNVVRNSKRNKGIWMLQDIRALNETTHALQCVTNILLNIIPKYIFSENIIHFNYKSIQKNTGFQVLAIEYECTFISLSSSKRDLDNNSEFDKFESFLTKSDESLYQQNKVNSQYTMELIDLMYGPFSSEEINHYIKALSVDGRVVINSFQKELIFNLFYKYFGDPQSVNAINLDDYIKLIIAARRILETNGLVLLPYILSSKIVRLATRKNVNKKELVKLESSPLYDRIKHRYKSEKIEKHILNIIAVLLSSEFQAIDTDDDEIDGTMINVVPELICEEVLMYISLI